MCLSGVERNPDVGRTSGVEILETAVRRVFAVREIGVHRACGLRAARGFECSRTVGYGFQVDVGRSRAYDGYAEFVGRVPREFSRRFVAVGARVGDLRVDLQRDAAAFLCDVGCFVDVVRTTGERHCRCGNEHDAFDNFFHCSIAFNGYS